MSLTIVAPVAGGRPSRRACGIRALAFLPAIALLLCASLLVALETPSKPFLDKNSFFLSSAGFRVQLANDSMGRKAPASFRQAQDRRTGPLFLCRAAALQLHLRRHAGRLRCLSRHAAPAVAATGRCRAGLQDPGHRTARRRAGVAEHAGGAGYAGGIFPGLLLSRAFSTCRPCESSDP